MDNEVLVITPAYCTPKNRRLHLLLETIYWVQQQTYPNTIHVVINDGSTDETPEVLEEIANRNPKMLIFHKENEGQSSAINFGVKQTLRTTSPRYITTCHSDDLLYPNSLEVRVKLAESTNSAMVYTDYVTFYEDGRASKRSIAREFQDSEALYRALIEHKGIPFPTMMWDIDFFTDEIQGYDPQINSAEDWDIALRTAQRLQQRGVRCEVSHTPTVAYRIHENNVRIQNLRDGTKWKCYKRILSKHLSGARYHLQLTKESLKLARSMLNLLPNPIKEPLRNIRDAFLSRPDIIPYRDEFLEKIRKIDYEKTIRSF